MFKTINYEGEIIFRRNLVFKDTNHIDFKIKGHPTVNIYCDGKETKFLLMTSTKRDGINYYTVKPDKKNKLKKETYIDLDHVYYEKPVSHFASGRLTCEIYNDMLKNFIIAGNYEISENAKNSHNLDINKNVIR